VFFSLFRFFDKKEVLGEQIQNQPLRLLIAVWLNGKKGGGLVLNF
jgi:hypothetical protein